MLRDNPDIDWMLADRIFSRDEKNVIKAAVQRKQKIAQSFRRCGTSHTTPYYVEMRRADLITLESLAEARVNADWEVISKSRANITDMIADRVIARLNTVLSTHIRRMKHSMKSSIGSSNISGISFGEYDQTKNRLLGEAKNELKIRIGILRLESEAPRLIELHEIDEFSKVKLVKHNAIDDKTVLKIRDLDEQKMETFIREILYDPSETPHGPTEIADMLTHHLHVNGESRLTAFVLKGKSFRNVSSKVVTHQFAKLRQIRGLGLMVFGAVGEIQDDARRDFVQVAIDARCDYLIIDAHDFARLFVSYEKTCPENTTL